MNHFWNQVFPAAAAVLLIVVVPSGMYYLYALHSGGTDRKSVRIINVSRRMLYSFFGLLAVFMLYTIIVMLFA